MSGLYRRWIRRLSWFAGWGMLFSALGCGAVASTQTNNTLRVQPLQTLPQPTAPTQITLLERSSPTFPAILFPPTPAITTPTPIPTMEVVDYIAYRVQAGDTLVSISKHGGSNPELLKQYNRLTAEPQPGRELIIPRLRNQGSLLPKRTLMVTKGNTAQPWVALTFDCGGDNPHATKILDILKNAHIHVTFFLLGGSIINEPDLLRRMVADGHELANHSYAHADFTTLSDEEITADLLHAETVIYDILGSDISIRPYFRFPYGSYDRRTLSSVIANGYLPIHWTIDSLDAVGQTKTPDFLAKRITSVLPANNRSGAIILAHCSSNIVDALPKALEDFAAEGVSIRTLSEVLGL